VKQWNESYESPRLLIATHAEMFREFERRYGESLPTYAGDFTPYWEDGAASSAYETMLNRQASDRLVQAEAVWAMRDPRSYPAAEFTQAWRNVVLYDEHTWGAHNSVSEPDLPFVKGQWEIKRRFATDADSMSKALLAKALGQRGTARIDSNFSVTNTHSWPRTELVVLPAERSSNGDLVVDQLGNAVPSQRLSTGELAVLVKDLPPFSTKHYRIKRGKALDPGSVRVFDATLENRTVRISVNAVNGAIESMMLRKNGVNLVDVQKGGGLNEYLYVPGKDPREAKRLQKVKIRTGEKGGLVSSLVIEAEAPGCNAYSYEVRLIADLDRVDIINRIDKKAIRTKEAIHIAFPFAVPDGELRYDVAWGIVRPELEQIPGSCRNFFSVQSWVDVSNAERGVIWSTPDAPLIEIGSINAEKPWMSTIDPAQNIFSYLMNNYWHTNYKADQEGLAAFRFSVRPHAKFDPAAAVRFGVEQRQSLILSFPDSIAGVQNLPFDFGTSDVLALSTKPLGTDGALHLTLYNPTAKPQALELKWKGKAMKVYVSDVDGKRENQVQGKIGIGRYGSMYLVLEPQ
jgi:alpha-mannosidase